ncbi:MAG: single-stranded-DNA-specific exonuclease RecJ [Clostridiales bacterium]|nr:single-stranded-DNA-specific exonuclease RecJ [Clostridiales bacterium]
MSPPPYTATVSRPLPWPLASAADDRVAHLVDALGISPVLARLLVIRGVDEPGSAERFLTPSLDRDWSPGACLPGMAAAASRVASAVKAGERIVVFGDFDADGMSSAALAQRGLAAMGAQVRATVPDRFTEGYGLTEASIERLAELAPQLVVTVDCGISSAAEVAALQARGIDVVVTDHHEPDAQVPVGIPVANPKLEPGHPAFCLAGAGVALKLVQAAGELLGFEGVWRDLTDLATLGTVADIVPLLGENRALVAHGLERMRRAPRAGLAALAVVSGCDITRIGSDELAFQMLPRLNAAGRMADPHIALELLTTDDPCRAEELARTLDDLNRTRQATERDLSEAAIAIAERTYDPADRVLLVAGEGWHDGVRGIVASRLARRYGVPALVFSVRDGVAHGSGRSVGGFDLFEAVSSASDLLERFGGHSAAVGITLPASLVDELRARLSSHIATAPPELLTVIEPVDALLPLGDIGLELVAEVETLAPFGHANPRPKFISAGVFMSSRERVGRSSEHLRFTAYDGADAVQAIAFRCEAIAEIALCDTAVDVAYELQANEWRGQTRVQMLVRDISVHQAPMDAPAAELVEDLFARADEILVREEYTGIAEADAFHTKLVGVTFEGRQEVIGALKAGTPLRIVRQPDNPHDSNAIALHEPRGAQIGFFNRRLAAVLAPVIDAGVEHDVEITDITGLAEDRSRGVNVLVTRRGSEPLRADASSIAERRAALAALDPAALDAELVRAFIGEGLLHDAQVSALAELAAGRRCLTIMATGRGKSLIFHIHAARTALAGGGASVFVFPLRALVADQAFHLEEVMAGLGVQVATLTGESSPTARDEGFAALRSGALDVVLTTPEFLVHHADRFAAAGRVRFAVVDEAHHAGTARAGHRPAYTRLGEVFESLGSPAVLAVTATAGEATAAAICAGLGIETVVTDPTVRENLAVVDERGSANKDGYLAALASRGEKMIVYVNSREHSVKLARMLRKRIPSIAMGTAFYNGGLARSARHAVERAFRAGEVCCVIATSAFGEGVNIPDVRHVVLYHLPFNDIEFNQMCGRAGRDGAVARVHLLFGPRDARVNEVVLTSVAPARDDLASLYAVLKEASAAHGDGFEAANADLAQSVCSRRRGSSMNERGVSTGIGVFRELGLLDAEGRGPYRRLTLVPDPPHVELSASVRYAEGLEEIAEFRAFKEWVLAATADELLERFNRPILPTPV